MVYSGEEQYMNLMQDIIEYGIDVPDRTGIGCRMSEHIDHTITFDEWEFPFSLTRSVPVRMAFEEFWFFIRGETQTKALENKKIFFWKGNTSREFLDNRGLHHLAEGDMGKAYGYQFRHNPDQLSILYDGLKNDPYGRRHFVTFWNANDLPQSALPPCHHSHQFVATPCELSGKPVLHLKVINRSLDLVFGFYFAAQQYRLYQIAMARLLGYRVGKLSFGLTHVHIYHNQLNYAKDILRVWDDVNYIMSDEMRDDGYDIDRVMLQAHLADLDDFIGLEWSDFHAIPPKNHEREIVVPKPPMAV